MDYNDKNQFNEDYNFNSGPHNDFNNEQYRDINFVMRDYEVEPIKKRGRKRTFFGYVAVALIAAIIGGLSSGYFVYSQFKVNQNGVEQPITAQDVNINLTDDVYFAVAVAEKSQKTVVGITTQATKQVNTWFGPQTQRSQSMGSGFIVDPNGYIVTNSHVIEDGKYDKITVSLIDGSTEVGEVLWYDKSLDLAVVKINRTNLPFVELGDSDKLLVGEPVVAIGNPMTLDLERTVTQGIISGLNRTIIFENGTVIEPLIQTDASINEGNSGGPLFNAKGQVIGINTAKINTAEGLGFSIPINTAKPIIDRIIKEGKLTTVYVGISGVEVETYETALGIEVQAEYGVVIAEVIKDSPASISGLQVGDVIIAIDGDKITSMQELKIKLYEYKDGDNAEITFLRNGNEHNVSLTLKTKPADL
ncbi:trypsin-like peptidase domain-containing protein [Sedimentibacter sp.]|uniref:S1C family serine protease n=1 Tax=Sedimentibacter sp. TaxID=1960295 RepID=UPI0028B258F0|nr:trypsin-like peptidase domain-containing protein [Sedimentibacter sp.]